MTRKLQGTIDSPNINRRRQVLNARVVTDPIVAAQIVAAHPARSRPASSKRPIRNFARGPNARQINKLPVRCKASAQPRYTKKEPGWQKNSNPPRFSEPPHTRVRLTKWVRQEGKMLTLTVLKSVVLVAGLVAASMFLQAAMTYGKLPLVIGQ